MKRRIRLRGINGDIEGKVWESETILRTGRLATLEIVLDDSSVSRRHAEVRPPPTAGASAIWAAPTAPSSTAPASARANGRSAAHDISAAATSPSSSISCKEGTDEDDASPNDNLLVEAAACNSWEDALDGLAFDRNRSPRPGEQLLALLRAGHHLVHLESEEELLHTILNDAVSTLDAQRGAIVLAEGPTGPLKLRALATRPQPGAQPARLQPEPGPALLQPRRIDPVLQRRGRPRAGGARSIAEGAMASVLCVLLRTPRKRLGVLHLDRGPLQKPFTKDDLHLADALAANVSAGIESAQLLRKQRELFRNTITMLAQAVECATNTPAATRARHQLFAAAGPAAGHFARGHRN